MSIIDGGQPHIQKGTVIMKKIIAAIMSLSLVFALASCGGDTQTTSSEAEVSSQAPVQNVSSVVSTPESKEEVSSEAPVVDSKNLALKGTAIADGVREAGKEEPNMNDGNTNTLWQSLDKGVETEENESWFGISWEEAQTFDTLFVLWEQAHPTENGFRVEISDDGETWTAVEFTAVRGGTPSDTLIGGLETDKQTDDITLAEAVTTKNVRIVCFTHYTMPENAPEYGGDTKSPTGVYEFEIYNSADLEEEVTSEAADETVAE